MPVVPSLNDKTEPIDNSLKSCRQDLILVLENVVSWLRSCSSKPHLLNFFLSIFLQARGSDQLSRNSTWFWQPPSALAQAMSDFTVQSKKEGDRNLLADALCCVYLCKAGEMNEKSFSTALSPCCLWEFPPRVSNFWKTRVGGETLCQQKETKKTFDGINIIKKKKDFISLSWIHSVLQHSSI